MSELPNQEIEGRLNAQREALAFLLAHVAQLEARAGGAPDRLIEALDEHAQLQDHQEDPGAVPAGRAFAIEAATMREFRLILEEARARLAELGRRNS